MLGPYLRSRKRKWDYTGFEVYFHNNYVLEKEQELANAQRELEQVNEQQVALARIQSTFDGMQPDIELICDNLALFAEVWASVRIDLQHAVLPC